MQLSQPGVPIQALAAGEVQGHAHPSQGLLGHLSAKPSLNFPGFLHCHTRFPVISRSSPASPAGLSGFPEDPAGLAGKPSPQPGAAVLAGHKRECSPAHLEDARLGEAR